MCMSITLSLFYLKYTGVVYRGQMTEIVSWSRNVWTWLYDQTLGDKRWSFIVSLFLPDLTSNFPLFYNWIVFPVWLLYVDECNSLCLVPFPGCTLPLLLCRQFGQTALDMLCSASQSTRERCPCWWRLLLDQRYLAAEGAFWKQRKRSTN